MTLPLPPHDGENLQFILDLIAQASIDTGGRQIKIRFGTSSVTFTASNESAVATIPHGLGSAPVVIGGFCRTPANARITVQETQAADATNIYLKGFQTDPTSTGTVTQNIYWLAIG